MIFMQVLADGCLQGHCLVRTCLRIHKRVCFNVQIVAGCLRKCGRGFCRLFFWGGSDKMR